MVTITETSQNHVDDWSSPYAQPRRPWLTLYGLRVKPKQDDEDGAKEIEKSLAPIQKLLPEELVLKVFEQLQPYALGRAACVCKQWGALTVHSALWKSACEEAFHAESREELLRLHRLQYRGSWRDMFLERPQLRFDGLYVSRNTYIRTGVTEWRVKNPVHMVCYFRYLRFMPNGRFLYRTSPEVVAKVAKSMRTVPTHVRADESLQIGRWQLKKEKLWTGMRYPNAAGTEIRSRMTLRSTVPGAYNRLDMETILSYDRLDGSATSMMELPSDEDMNLEGAQQHRRGLAPYVFVPHDQVATSVLNYPVSKMDFYLPG